MACIGQKTGEKHTYLCVFYGATSEECVKATPALKKKSQLLCFPAVRKYIFLRADTTLLYFYSSHIESSLVGIQFKSNPRLILNEQAS